MPILKKQSKDKKNINCKDANCRFVTVNSSLLYAGL